MLNRRQQFRRCRRARERGSSREAKCYLPPVTSPTCSEDSSPAGGSPVSSVNGSDELLSLRLEDGDGLVDSPHALLSPPASPTAQAPKPGGLFSWWILLSSSTFPSPLTILTSPMFEPDVVEDGEQDYETVRWSVDGEEKGDPPAGGHSLVSHHSVGGKPPFVSLSVIGEGLSPVGLGGSAASMGREAESKEDGDGGRPLSPVVRLTKRGKPAKQVGFSATDRIVLIPARADYDDLTKSLLWWSLSDYEAFKQATLADYQKGIRDFTQIADEEDEEVQQTVDEAAAPIERPTLCEEPQEEAKERVPSPSPQRCHARQPVTSCEQQQQHSPVHAVVPPRRSQSPVLWEDGAAGGSPKIISYLSHDKHEYRAAREALEEGDESKFEALMLRNDSLRSAPSAPPSLTRSAPDAKTADPVAVEISYLREALPTGKAAGMNEVAPGAVPVDGNVMQDAWRTASSLTSVSAM